MHFSKVSSFKEATLSSELDTELFIVFRHSPFHVPRINHEDPSFISDIGGLHCVHLFLGSKGFQTSQLSLLPNSVRSFRLSPDGAPIGRWQLECAVSSERLMLASRKLEVLGDVRSPAVILLLVWFYNQAALST